MGEVAMGGLSTKPTHHLKGCSSYNVNCPLHARQIDMKAAVLRIGELAEATASRRETIRYYEREKLLPAPARTGGNYRVYNQTHVERLTFIRHCRALDMSLQEIRALLSFYDAPTQDCTGANVVIDAHIDDVSRRIGELSRLRKHLQELRALCRRAQAVRNCGMLHELGAPVAKPPAARASRERSTPKARR